MKTGKNIIWGIVLVIIGVLLGLNAFDIFTFDIFFDGWWTLFIIIPSFIGLFTDNDKTGSIVGMIIGVLLLLACQDVLNWTVVGKLILPIIIVAIGLSLLFKNMIYNKINKSIQDINSKTNTDEEYKALFAAQDIKIDDDNFDGTAVKAVFGGIKLDLRKATIKKDVVIKCDAIFGGVDIFLPDDVNVQVKSSSVFGGVDNKCVNKDNKVTVYIDATCAFGGVDIK